MSKKTILIATDNFMPRIDGISRFLEMLLPSLDKYNVIVIAPDFKGSYVKKGNYLIHRIPLGKLVIGDYHISKKPKNLAPIIEKADLIFSNTIGPIGNSVIEEAYKQNKKILCFIHSIEWILVEKSLGKFNPFRGILSMIAKFFARKYYSKATGLIVPSTNVGNIFSLAGIVKSKYVIHLGINTDNFKPNNKEEAKANLGISPDTFVVGYVGRIAREKSLMTLKNAFKRVETKNKKLLIVGEGIKNLEREFKSDSIKLTGRVDNVVPYLNAMDAFVMPSLTETSCIAALEAMSCEVPVITTKVGLIRNYIIHSKNGLFFPKENETVLGIRLNHINSETLKAKDMAKNARKTVVQDYNWEKTKQKILKLIAIYTE